ARGGPNIKVERSPPVAGLAEAEGKGRAGATGAPGTGPAGGCAAARAAGWLNTTVERPGGAGFFGATGAVLRFPVWNIIVRPAASSAAGAAGFAMGACAGGAGGAGRASAAGAGASEAGAANIIVVCAAEGLAGGGGAAFAGRAASAAAAGRTTLNVFWHLPQRMVSPCGPIRASSTRYRAWHFSQRTSMDGSPGDSRGETYRIAHCPVKRCPAGLGTRKVDGTRVALTVARKRVRPEGVVRAEVRMGSKGKNGAAPKGASWKTPVAGILLAGVG